MSKDATDAWGLLAGKVSIPAEMRTAEWLRVPQWLRERAFFMAGVHRAEILEEFRKEVGEIAAGRRGIEESRKRLEQYLDKTGYQPAPGQSGTIKDLRSAKRMLVSLRTNVALLQGWSQKERGMRPGALQSMPAWELVRVAAKKVPRDWQERFQRVGGKLSPGGRIIALKTSDLWRKLGTDFPDSIGVDYPPLAWGSGMQWRGVGFRETKELGLLEGWKPPVEQPVASPNEALQVKPAITDPLIKEAIADHLQGLAEWKDDVLVFTDPNGTRPYPDDKLAEVITAKLPDDVPNLQAEAVKEFAADAMANIKLKRGTDRVDDFVRFALRTEPLPPATPVHRGESYARRRDLETRLEELAEGAEVDLVADSWSLLEDVAARFARRQSLPYELVLTCRKHGSLRPIYRTIKKVHRKYWRQAEVLAVEGTRFRLVGEPSFERAGDVVRVYVEVEELP
jgi:hypothetical protein